MRWCWVCAGCLAWPLVCAAEEDGAALLKAAVFNQSWRSACEFQVVVEFELERGLGPEYQRFTSFVRRDGGRLDFEGDFTLLEAESREPKAFAGNHSFRRIADGEWWLSRTTDVGRKKLNGGRSAEIGEYSSRAIESHQHGFSLDGHFPGNQGATLAEILLGAEGREVSTREIGGVACIAISAATEYGDVEICVDPKRSGAVLMSRITKTPDSKYEDQTLGTHAASRGIDSWTATVSDVVVERIGDYYVPVSGTVMTETAIGGQRTRFLAKVVRTDFNTSPDFTGTDAFQMDFEDGARISDWDLPERQIGYIWRKGTMTPEGAAGTQAGIGNHEIESGSAARRVWLVLIINIVVAGVIMLLYMARQRRRNP